MRRTVLAVLGLAIGLSSWLAVAGAFAHPSASHKAETLSELIRDHPQEARLYVERGAAYAEDRRDELALADFEKAAALGEPALAAFDLGVLHYRAGRYEAARAAFDTFLERHPGHPRALELRARLLRDAGQVEASLADFRASFAAQPRPHPGNYVSAAHLIASLEGAGPGPALALLDEGMARLGLVPQLQRPAVALELERGDTAAAVERMASLGPVLGRSPAWKVEMGELLLRADRTGEAQRLLREASAELAALRRTPARQRVLERIEALAPAHAVGSAATAEPPAAR